METAIHMFPEREIFVIESVHVDDALKRLALLGYDESHFTVCREHIKTSVLVVCPDAQLREYVAPNVLRQQPAVHRIAPGNLAIITNERFVYDASHK